MSAFMKKSPDENVRDNELESLHKLMEELSTDSSFDPKIYDISQNKTKGDFVLKIDGIKTGSAFDRDDDDETVDSSQTTIIQKFLESQNTNPLVSNPKLATIYRNLGWLYEKTGKYKKVLHVLRRAVEFAKSTLCPNNPYFGTIYVTFSSGVSTPGRFVSSRNLL